MRSAAIVPPAHQQLASRFRRALLYVVESLSEVGTTKLQKILYLADLEHFNATGTTLTGARWVRYTHGPMAKALLPSTEVMDGHEVVVAHEVAAPYETRVYSPGHPRFHPNLTSEECFARAQRRHRAAPNRPSIPGWRASRAPTSPDTARSRARRRRRSACAGSKEICVRSIER